MTAFDLPLDELRELRPPLHLPEGFAGFWDRTLSELAAQPAAVRRAAEPTGLRTLEVDDVRFTGWGGTEVAAWLLRPAGATGPLPCVVEFQGYGRGRGLPHESLLFSSAGYAHLVVDTRGQGSEWSVGVTADTGYDGSPATPGVMTRGLHDPHEHYYRRVYADAVRAVEVARSLPEVDPEAVFATGRSQGGGISLAVSGLVPWLAGVMADVPFLCAIRRAVDLTDSAPYAELVRWCSVHRDHVEQAFTTLDHVDAVHLVTRSVAPALFSVALRDPVCPPSTVFSAFNHYGGDAAEQADKEIRVWPANEHEGGGAHQEREQLSWLAARLAARTRRAEPAPGSVRSAPSDPDDAPVPADEPLNPA